MSSCKHGLGLYLLLLVFSHSLLTSPVAYARYGFGRGFGFIPLPYHHHHHYHYYKMDLLHDINTYRKALNLPILEENYKASCLAEKVSYDLEDKHCEDYHNFHHLLGSNPKIPNFERSVKNCDININTTKDGVIMPVCVPYSNEDDLFSNFTQNSYYTEYLNKSKYTVAGLSLYGDRQVLIISTNTTSGDFSSASHLLGGAFKGGHWLLIMATFLSVFVLLFN